MVPISPSRTVLAWRAGVARGTRYPGGCPVPGTPEHGLFSLTPPPVHNGFEVFASRVDEAVIGHAYTRDNAFELVYLFSAKILLVQQR